MSMSEKPHAGGGGTTDESTGVVDQVAQTASTAVESAKRETSDLVESGMDQARDFADEALDQARDLLSEARSEVRERASEEGAKIAAALDATAKQLQSMAAGADDPHHPIVEATRQAANRTQAMADRLSSGGVDGLMTDVKRFARQRPVLFLGGVVGIGVLAGRVLRNADRSRLTEAASPSGNGNSAGNSAGNGADDGGAPAAVRPAPAPAMPTPVMAMSGDGSGLVPETTPLPVTGGAGVLPTGAGQVGAP